MLKSVDNANKAVDLCVYRMNNAKETLESFYVASYDEAAEQYNAAASIIDSIQIFLNGKQITGGGA